MAIEQLVVLLQATLIDEIPVRLIRKIADSVLSVCCHAIPSTQPEMHAAAVGP